MDALCCYPTNIYNFYVLLYLIKKFMKENMVWLENSEKGETTQHEYRVVSRAQTKELEFIFREINP